MKNNDLVKLCDKYLKSIPSNLNYITPKNLKLLISKDPDSVFLLDNRTEESFKKYHIKNAVNIYFKEILDIENLSILPKDKTIVVCCWVGHTAGQVLTVLQLLGYNAIGLKYGYGVSAIDGEDQRGWLQLNYPLIQEN